MNHDRSVSVSIILVNYNGANVIINCLQSLQQFLRSISYEVIVVDNASSDGSPEAIAATFPQIHLIKQLENRGFGAGNNAGAEIAQGEFLFFLNTDTLITSDILPKLLAVMEAHPDVGIIGPKLFNLDGSLQLSVAHEISILGEYKTRKQHAIFKNSTNQSQLLKEFNANQFVDIVIGAALFIRKQLFEELDGFDEAFFMYFEESDLCQRTRDKGWKILYTPDISLIHLGGYSVNKVSNLMALEYRRSQLYYYQKHRSLGEQLLLRFYLLLKFLPALARSRQPIYLEIIALILDFNHYLSIQNNAFSPKKTASDEQS